MIEIKDLKNYIYSNNKIEEILLSLNFHHLKWHNNMEYISCGFHDGDNISSTIIYNNENLNVNAYTRDITDKYGISDIISLVCFVNDCYFSHAIKYICDLIGIEYYSSETSELPKSLQWTKMIVNMNKSILEDEEVKVLKPIDEKILSYYNKFVNDMFKNDGISYHTQLEFEIGFDIETNRITIPIRDEISTLVGIKGRLFKNIIEENEQKYLYLEKCAKSKILYGLYKTLQYIKEKNEVIVVESEKGVLQLWSIGIFNVVAIGGHQISKHQKNMLIRLGVNIVIAFDKDILEEEIINQCKEFPNGININYLYDYNNILFEKESPTDNIDNFKNLYENKLIYIR